MSAKFYTLLTDIGAAKLASAAALGVPLKITRMAVGDGGGVLPTPDAKQTALVNEKRRADLNMLYIDPQNSSQIIAEQVIPETEGGWWIREVGLFDETGALIAVGNCPESYKPQLAEGSGRTQTVRMVLITSSTDNITLKIDPAVVLATRKYVDDKVLELKVYVDDLMAKHTAASDPHTQYAPKASPTFTGTPKAPTAATGNNSTQLANTAFVQAAIAALVDSSPGALDTLNELAKALGNDPNFATTMTNALAGKQPLDNTLTSLSGKSAAALLAYIGAVDANGGDYNKFFNFKQVGTLPVDENPNYLVSADATITGGLVAWLQNQWHGNTVRWGAVRGAGADLQCAGIDINGELIYKFFTDGTIKAKGKDLATQEYVRSSVTALINSSPAALDTLKELADALGNDPNFATTMTNALAGKQPLDSTLTSLSGKNVAQLLSYLGVKSAALRDVGTGTNQIPDMNSFQSGSNGFGTWMRLPSGIIIQFGLYPTSGTTGGISFPTPFTSGPSYSLSPTGVTGIMAIASGASLTAINDVRTFDTAGNMLTNGVLWIAIGR